MLQWLDAVLPHHGPVTPASSDASFRRYFRVPAGNSSWIVMDAPPAQEDCTSFVAIAAWLAAQGLAAPRVESADREQGFLLLSDLGDTTYLQALNAQTADSLYGAAMAALIQMQAAPPPPLPAFDAALLQREMDLFADWYLAQHCQQPLLGDRRRAWERCCTQLIERALAQPQGFVHRDYHSRNLMVRPGQPPGILDFQDAVRGPVSYDLVSLLRDCYIAWPLAQLAAWRADYHAQALAAGIAVPALTDFVQDFDWMGVQRHLKAVGIFARLNHRDGKPAYLADIPRTLNYIRTVAAAYPELQPLVALATICPA